MSAKKAASKTEQVAARRVRRRDTSPTRNNGADSTIAQKVAHRIGAAILSTEAVKDAEEKFNLMLGMVMGFSGMTLLIVGESGVGKTRILDFLSQSMQPCRTADGWLRPLVRVNVPASPTAISLFEAVLAALGDPKPEQGTRSKKKFRLFKMLSEQEVRVLQLDDFQHFYDRDSQRVLFEASEALKEILTAFPLALVCAGLPDAERVMKANEQLKRRHMAPVRISRFNWSLPDSRKEMKGVLLAFSACLPDLEWPDMKSEEVGIRFFLATGGIMDFIAKLFGYVEHRAADGRLKEVTMEVLAHGWKSVLAHAQDEAECPFALKEVSDRENRIHRALKINQVVPPAPKRRAKHADQRLCDIGL